MLRKSGKTSGARAVAPDRPKLLKTQLVEQIIERYGDLVFDLCESVLWSTNHAQLAFRATLKAVRADAEANRYNTFERAWVLSVACEKLKDMARQLTRKITPEEQIQLDATEKVSTRLKHFDHYFHRLTTEDQILLLLRDKYGLPYPEIAAAMSAPEGSLKIRRQQALRALEEWLWNHQ